MHSELTMQFWAITIPNCTVKDVHPIHCITLLYKSYKRCIMAVHGVHYYVLLYLQSIYIHIMHKFELSLIVQSGIKTAHHIVC